MFFAKPGIYKPSGIFNLKHLLIAIITLIGVSIAVKKTKIAKEEDVKKIIKKVTIIVWCLEIIKIIYMVSIGQAKINRIVPLYYCSLLLYSGLLSSFGKGILKKIGDTFLATGCIIGGIIFIIFPTTSLPEYPLLHFISFHSFIYHGIMLYIGLIVNKTKYVKLKFLDIKYYSSLIFIICMVAYVINRIYGSNLMFISQDFPGSPLSYFYNNMGYFFAPTMILVQMTVPFLIVYTVYRIFPQTPFKIAKNVIK